MECLSWRRTIRAAGVVVLFFAGISGGVVCAEETGTAVASQTLDPVVVTATKTPVSLSQVTSAVEIITEQDLQRQKFKTVADALRLSPGLAVFSSGGPGTETSVRIRGANDRHTLVVVDGAIVNSTTLGSFNFADLTTDNIERIEILRGPQGMVWGSDAMGGVVNIITKRGRGSLQARVFLEYGSFQSLREGASVSGQRGPVDASLSLSRFDTAGLSAADYRLGAAERDAYRNWTGSSKVGVALPHEGRLELAFRWHNSDVHIDNISTPSDVFGSKQRSRSFIYSGSHEQPFTTWWSQKITLARAQEDSLSLPGTLQRNLNTNALSVPGGAPNETRVLSSRIEVQEQWRIGDPLRLTAGYQFRDQAGENDIGISNKYFTSHAGFVEAQAKAWDRVVATAGLRQERYSVFGDATTYRVTGGYLLHETQTKLRGSYATGFRAPTINQLFFPNFGNPTLRSEKSRGFDVGVDQRFFEDRVRLSLGYFWNRFRDLIVFTTDPRCAPFSTGSFCPLNIGAAVSKGWEASAAWSLVRDHPLAKNLDLQGQYTNTLTRDVDTARRLPRNPVDQWSVALSYRPIAPLETILAARYVGSRFDAANNRNSQRAFDVWNFSAAYDVTKQMQVYTRVENLFDEKYQEIRNAGTAGRSLYVGVTMRYDAP